MTGRGIRGAWHRAPRATQAGGSRLHPLEPGTVRSVVVARLEDNEVVAVDQVDETVLVSDTPRPGAGVPDKPHSVLPVEVVLLGPARARPVIGVKQPAGVGRGAEQVGGLLPGRVLVSGHEDDAALP